MDSDPHKIAEANVSSSSKTWIDLLLLHASRTPAHPAFTFLRDGESEDCTLTFKDLLTAVQGFAAQLQRRELRNERALLLLPSGPEFIITFLGCLFAEVIAVPLPHFHPNRPRQGGAWFSSLVRDASPTVAFAAPEILKRLPKQWDDPAASQIEWLNPSALRADQDMPWEARQIGKDSVAFLQYTSGSTSTPKGVIVSHKNLLHNMEVIRTSCNMKPDSTVVTWLPFHHDMGLIGTILQPLYVGAHCIVLPPSTFLNKPVLWLQAISRYKAFCSSAPNFAYELCTRKITAEQCTTLDLSNWRVAINGAEPVMPSTIERFRARFAPYGFRQDAFHPSYGLAEATLMVTGSHPNGVPNVKHVSTDGMESGLARDRDGDELSRALTSCGSIHVRDQNVLIVDPVKSSVNPEGKIGEIWISGPSVAQGYWNRPEETKLTFKATLVDNPDAHFLRSGDLGFIASDQLYVTGRLKDLIIIRGRNVYPQDLEITTRNANTDLRDGRSVAFSIPVDDQETLVLLNEVKRTAVTSPEQLISAIRRQVLHEHALTPHCVVLVKEGSLPLTTSGKIRRSSCREAFLSGNLRVIARSIADTADSQATIAAKTTLPLEFMGASDDDRLSLLKQYLLATTAELTHSNADEISCDETFVSLGLHSLGATEIAHRVSQELDLKVGPVDLLGDTTINEFSRVLLNRFSVGGKAVNQQAQHPLSKCPTNTYPLSAGQRGLWFVHNAAPNSTAYLLSSALLLEHSVRKDALEEALFEVMGRHDSLRATFVIQNSDPIQIVRPLANLSRDRHFTLIRLHDATDLKLGCVLAELVRQPFSLDRDPPIRLVLIDLTDGRSVILLVLHHIIADLHSIEVILKDLDLAYRSHIDKNNVTLPLRQAWTYAEFVSEEAERFTNGEGETSLSYWVSKLAGELPILSLSTTQPHSAISKLNGSIQNLHFTPDLYRDVRQLAIKLESTPFMILVAAFQVLLHRLSGQKEILLGTPTNGRTSAKFASVVGYFTNSVVLRSRYNGSIRFSDYLTDVRQTVLEALQHQDCPFPVVVEKLHPERTAGRSPLFQTMFVWQELWGENGAALAAASVGDNTLPLKFGSLSGSFLQVANPASQFDITLLLAPSRDNLVGAFKYNTDLFRQETVERFGRYLASLIEGVVLNPACPLADLPLPPDNERALVRTSDGSDTRAQSIPIHQLVEKQAAKNSTSIAVIAEDIRVSYRELNRRANQLARYLISLRLGAEAPIGVCLPRSVHSITVMLAIWKAAAVYVPLDESAPARVAAVLKRTCPSVLITTEAFLEKLPRVHNGNVLLDLECEEIKRQEDSDIQLPIPNRTLAYVIHTSGSTGEPKGVMIEHGSLSHLRTSLESRIYSQLDRPLIVGVNAPLTFDSSMKQLVMLASGDTLCIIPDRIRRVGSDLRAFISRVQLDVLDCTPTQVHLLLPTRTGQEPMRCTLLVGGESISETMWRELSSQPRLCYNVYGPTECTVDATTATIESGAGPFIGEPLPGVSVYLLDEDLLPVVIERTGEIYISGPMVGRGYLGRPDATAESFLPDPFATIAGARMYRTGDRARLTIDRRLQFVGRKDRQIKLRGFRVELGEIEDALLALEGIAEAIVMARREGDESTRLIAYVVTDGELNQIRYRNCLMNILPEYMIPHTFLKISVIPKNMHGKRDYSALPSPPVVESGERAASYSSTEEYLLDLWAKILQTQVIGLEDNFFSLGGDSLQATRVIARLQEDYPNAEALLPHFFEEPTIASLARHLLANSPDASSTAAS